MHKLSWLSFYCLVICCFCIKVFILLLLLPIWWIKFILVIKAVLVYLFLLKYKLFMKKESLWNINLREWVVANSMKQQ